MWAWNPLKWFGKGQEGFIIGVSANTDLTNVTYFGGLYSPDFSPVAGYCSNTKYGMGGEDANNPGSFYYPSYTPLSAEDVANKVIRCANNKVANSEIKFNDLYAKTVERLEGKPYLLGANGPNAFDCSSTACYGIRTAANSSFGDYTANDLFLKFSKPSNNLDRGSVIFYDYNSDGGIDHVTTILNSSEMLHPSSGAGILQIRPIHYLDSYTIKKGGSIYYKEFNWSLIINKTR